MKTHVCYKDEVPRIVDHDSRRAEIAAAVRRLLLRDGVAAATVRGVAQEAGWSAGAVRHYFPDQAALLRLVIAQTFEAVPERLDRRLRAWFEEPASRDPVPDAQGLLEELLPLDEVRRVETDAWLATMDAARRDPELDQTRALAWKGTRQVSRIAVAWVRGRDLDPELGRLLEEPLPDPEDERAAAVLQALLDGLALQCFAYADLVDAATVRATLRDHLWQVARGA